MCYLLYILYQFVLYIMEHLVVLFVVCFISICCLFHGASVCATCCIFNINLWLISWSICLCYLYILYQFVVDIMEHLFVLLVVYFISICSLYHGASGCAICCMFDINFNAIFTVNISLRNKVNLVVISIIKCLFVFC